MEPKKGLDSNYFLTLSDQLRDEILPHLGVRVEDGSASLTYKLVDDKEQLINEIAKKKETIKQQRVDKLKNQIMQLEKDLKNWETKRLTAQELLESTGNYSEFGSSNGLPSKDSKGKVLSDSAMKKAEKLFNGQLKQHQSYLDKISTNPNFLNDLHQELLAKKSQLLDLQSLGSDNVNQN